MTNLLITDMGALDENIKEHLSLSDRARLERNKEKYEATLPKVDEIKQRISEATEVIKADQSLSEIGKTEKLKGLSENIRQELRAVSDEQVGLRTSSAEIVYQAAKKCRDSLGSKTLKDLSPSEISYIQTYLQIARLEFSDRPHNLQLAKQDLAKKFEYNKDVLTLLNIGEVGTSEISSPMDGIVEEFKDTKEQIREAYIETPWQYGAIHIDSFVKPIYNNRVSNWG